MSDKLERRRYLSYDEEVEYVQRHQSGDREALNTLLDNHRKHIRAIARKNSGFGLDQEELEQIGTIGWLEGVKRYDATKRKRLTTYTSYYIRKHIWKALDNLSRTVRITKYARDRVRDLEGLVGEQLDNKSTRQKKSRERHRVVGNMLRQNLSIYITREDETWERLLPEQEDREDQILQQLDAPYTNQLLSRLTQSLTRQQKAVLYYRYGFSGHVHTQNETAEILGVSRNRVSQIELGTIEKLQRAYTKEKSDRAKLRLEEQHVAPSRNT